MHAPPLQEQLRHEKSLYSHLEYEYHATQRNLREVQSNLHLKEVELQQQGAQVRAGLGYDGDTDASNTPAMPLLMCHALCINAVHVCAHRRAAKR